MNWNSFGSIPVALSRPKLVEMRVKSKRSAADVFREIGPWEGESTADLMQRLDEERRRGGTKEPPRL